MVVCYGSQTYWYSTLRTEKNRYGQQYTDYDGMKQRHGRIAHVLGRYPSVYSLRVFLTNHFFLCCPYTSPFLRIPPSKPKKKNHLGSSIAATDKRSECSHHLRSSHTTSPCLSVFHLDFLLGIQVPTRPRYPVRSRRDLAPSSLARIPKQPQISPSLEGLGNSSGSSADMIYRRASSSSS